MLVCIFRFEPARERGVDENDRKTCGQGRSELVDAEEASLMIKDDGAFKGTKTRRADMI